MRFIELAGEINTRMPHFVVDKLALALDRRCAADRAPKRCYAYLLVPRHRGFDFLPAA